MASRRSSNASGSDDRFALHRTADPRVLATERWNRSDAVWIENPVEPRALVANWCGVGDLPEELIARSLLHRARELVPVESEARSVIEREWQIASAPGAGDSDEAIEIARTLLAAADDSPIQTIREGLAQLRGKGFSEAEIFRKLVLVNPKKSRPILVIATAPVDRFIEIIRFSTAAVELAIGAAFFLVVDPSGWDRLGELLDSHTVALLTHGIIDLLPTPRPVLRYAERPDSPASDPALRCTSESAWINSSSVRELQQHATRAVKIARNIPTQLEPQTIPEEYALARSLAEALLYAALQASPITRDLFSLNADGGFRFGARQVEIDLLCPSLRIAVEVDGYFHFQDNTGYRRDRAKDFLMQAEGLLVLRFLAGDVTDRLDSILADIFKAVSHRQKENG